MNLPVLAMDFLDIFVGFRVRMKNWSKQLPMIHVYGFIKGDSDEELKQLAELRIRGRLPNFEIN
jgi:hypothetical protein